MSAITRLVCAVGACAVLSGGAVGCGPAEPAQNANANVAQDQPTTIEVAAPSPAPVIHTPEPQPQLSRLDALACFDQLMDGSMVEALNPPVDRELYTQGLEHERRGRVDLARKSYLELVENHKLSAFVPLAYLRFGELFAKEAEEQPVKWSIGQKFYKEVLKYPPPESLVFGFAAYRSGIVHQKLQEHVKALDTFQRAIEHSARFSQSPCTLEVAQLSRREMVLSYAEVGAPLRAFSLFHTVSGDTGSDHGATVEMMLQLAERYEALGRQQPALQVLNDLLQRGSGDAICSRALAVIGKIDASSATEQRQKQRVESSCSQ